MGEAPSVANLMKLMIEDRKKREEEIAAERERREREMDARVQEMARQMEMMRNLVEKGQRDEGINRVGGEQIKLTKLSESDDVEAYLTTFERMMEAYRVEKSKWAYLLAPQLTGKAQQAYAAMAGEESGDYDSLKDAILKRYNINEESYRTRFRSVSRKSEESYCEMATRTMDLLRKWTRQCENLNDLLEVVAVEQLLNSMPTGVRIWVSERKPKTVAEAGKLADDYTLARGVKDNSRNQESHRESPKGAASVPKRCHTCGRPGHLARDCRQGSATARTEAGNKEMTSRGEKEGPRCYNCQQRGHFANQCPSRAAMFIQGTAPEHERGPSISGLVEGKPVSRILLDTGAATTMVHRDLVPTDKLTSESVPIRCAHGDVSSYPMAQVSMTIGKHTFPIKVAVSSSLPVPVLLGRDVPDMFQWLPAGRPVKQESQTGSVFVATTRLQAKVQAQEAQLQPQVDPQEGLGETFHEDLFGESRERARLTRSQRRAHQVAWREQGRRHSLDLEQEQLKEMQKVDASLQAIWEEVGRDTGPSSRFFIKEGLLYRRARGRGTDDEETEQLVLPTPQRRTVLELAHSIPWAGHLGKKKTCQRILRRFYWPTLHKDVDIFCKGCAECQKVSPRKGAVAALVPLPIIEVPFQRIAMDIVGPLPKSRCGNRYILVICDYATRWPEAIPLKSIEAVHVAEELMVLFSRVGVPKEILTDQGTNFTSNLLAEVYRLLHIQPIRTSPYHPQTDGLVERFNQTLKSMLKKAATEEGKDWDKLIPYVLFAYREVPQASTGFSPFELVYGRPVRGPLDVLKESWEVGTHSKESVLSYVLAAQERLDKMATLVKGNLDKAQRVQKRWYDRNARQREFKVGDNVLVLLPTATNKLLAKWQGPYPVMRKVGPVTYEINMFDHVKKKRILHVNMLKLWHPPATLNLWNEEVGEVEDVLLWRDQPGDAPTSREAIISDQLTEGQHQRLAALLLEYREVMCSDPGRTTLVEHHIDTGRANPIRLPPYRVPYAHREAVERELADMLQAGIVETSNSSWAAPIVLVQKKDGTLRFCVDYRKLNAISKVDPYPMPRIDELSLTSWGRLSSSQPWICHVVIGRSQWPSQVRRRLHSSHRKGCSSSPPCHLGCRELQQLSSG